MRLIGKIVKLWTRTLSCIEWSCKELLGAVVIGQTCALDHTLTAIHLVHCPSKSRALIDQCFWPRFLVWKLRSFIHLVRESSLPYHPISGSINASLFLKTAIPKTPWIISVMVFNRSSCSRSLRSKAYKSTKSLMKRALMTSIKIALT